MKRFIPLFLCLCALAGTASARNFKVGVRGGVNLSDYTFDPIRIDGTAFSSGSGRVGYEGGLVLRLDLSKHLHLQSELNYAAVRYEVRANNGSYERTVALRTQRFQIPVELGVQLGVVRLFGGAQFRVASSVHSSNRSLLQAEFNDRNVSLIGGLGLNIRKFFIDFRVSGYPRARVWHRYTSHEITRRVSVPHDVVYGGSIGFFF